MEQSPTDFDKFLKFLLAIPWRYLLIPLTWVLFVGLAVWWAITYDQFPPWWIAALILASAAIPAAEHITVGHIFRFSKRVDALTTDVTKANDQLLNLTNQVSTLSATVHTTSVSKADPIFNVYLDRDGQMAADAALKQSPLPSTSPYALNTTAYVAEVDKKLFPALVVLRALYSYYLTLYLRRLPTYNEVIVLPAIILIDHLKDCIAVHPMLPELRQRRLYDLNLIGSLLTLRESVANGTKPVPSLEAGVPLLDQVNVATVGFQSYLTTITATAAGI